MKRAYIFSGFGVLLLVGTCFGVASLYQNHLSGGLKRTLLAAADPNCTEADLATYIRDGRIQVRTKRDRFVLEKLARAVELGEDSEELNRAWWQNSQESISLSVEGRCHDFDNLSYQQLHSAYGDLLDRQCKQELAQQAENRKSEDSSLELSRDEAAAAGKLFNEFRADLGLPPVKNQ